MALETHPTSADTPKLNDNAITPKDESSAIGIGLDSCIIPLSKHGLHLVQSTDFFYPLIDNPYWMGKITCANVTSDVFATGVTTLDSLNMIISLPTEMSKEQSDIILPLVIQGFVDNAKKCNIQVKFDNLFTNPWLIIGGTATSICLENEFISPTSITAGDLLILTKPLGAQIACNTQKLREDAEKWEKYKPTVADEEVNDAFKAAVISMARLNRQAALLMHKYKAHGATDVTGFGILGHAENLVAFQCNDVDLVIDALPVIANVCKFAQISGRYERFVHGRSPETSGGLLIALPADAAAAYCKEIEDLEGHPAWVVGHVEDGTKTARIVENPRIEHVTLPSVAIEEVPAMLKKQC